LQTATQWWEKAKDEQNTQETKHRLHPPCRGGKPLGRETGWKRVNNVFKGGDSTKEPENTRKKNKR